jgi:glycosyltransferase involved in cell wall biosynthesis
MRLSGSSRPISVCFVIDRLSRAGTESQLLALLRKIDRRRVTPSLCLLNSDDQDSLSLLPDSCPVLDLRLRKLASAAAVPAASRLAAFWRGHHVEVVQTYFLDSTYFAAPLARLCGIPHVVRVRNNTGYWLTPRHRFLGRMAGRLTTTLTNSEVGRLALQTAEGTNSDRIAVIENGIDLDLFRNCPSPSLDRSDVRVGAVANLRPVKNIDGFIRAARMLRPEFPELRFEVAGAGPERSSLEQLIADAHLTDRFVLRGQIAYVPDFLSQIDIAILCSHSESMSNALLEYMAAGRAIVATDVGANSQLIRHEVEGLIVPPGDDGRLANAIRRLIREPECAQQFAAAARRRAEAEFSRERMVRRFEEFYWWLARQPDAAIRAAA